MKVEYHNEGQLYDTRYSKNEDVRDWSYSFASLREGGGPR